MKNRPFSIFLATLAILVVSESAIAFESKKALKGIATVDVIVEEIPPSLSKLSSIVHGLESSVAAGLKRSGLKISPDSEQVFYVSINGGSLRGVFAFDSSVQLMERVRLARDPRISTFATTWQKSTTGIAGEQELLKIGINVNRQVDMFYQ